MSVPSTNTVLANLRAEGNCELAKRIEEGASTYCCPRCEVRTKNPGVVLESDDPWKLAFYCPLCSGERVRPDRIELEGEGFRISAPITPEQK